jgi:hypothetical protein
MPSVSKDSILTGIPFTTCDSSQLRQADSTKNPRLAGFLKEKT